VVWNDINNVINVKFLKLSYILGTWSNTSRSHSTWAFRYTIGNAWVAWLSIWPSAAT